MEFKVLIPLCTALAGSILGYISARRNMIRDTEQRTAEITTVIVKLDGIAKNVDKIQDNMDYLRKDLNDLREKIATVEAATKSAHHRLDAMERSV